jgi:endonuclease YncB( thermonuclease family)
LILASLLGAAWFYGGWADGDEAVLVAGKKLAIADGDSFSIGNRKLRLDGIDAPEYGQSCKDFMGVAWQCGEASRTALEQLLRQPGLACTATATDKYARAIATCSTSATPDIGAAQVTQGMAVSDEFYGIRSYGDEEDGARSDKRGLWIGEFLRPVEWRAANGR